MVRKKLFFSGRVQGVGFRYQSAWIARELGLTGWVRNRTDGRVEMEVQGKETLIEEMLLRLKEDSYIQIRQVESEELPLAEYETKFQTKFTHYGS